MHSAKEWILRRQQSDGSFNPIGRIYNKDLQGTVDNTLALTAYVLNAIWDTKMDLEEENFVMAKAKKLLEAQISKDKFIKFSFQVIFVLFFKHIIIFPNSFEDYF